MLKNKGQTGMNFCCTKIRDTDCNYYVGFVLVGFHHRTPYGYLPTRREEVQIWASQQTQIILIHQHPTTEMAYRLKGYCYYLIFIKQFPI